MKTLTGFGVLVSTALFAAQAAVTNAPADFMIQNFLKAEAARLDARFLEGVTNRAQWEARRGELRQQYLEMLGLMKDARVVLTDSGGMQEETTALGIPCLTLRENTERPITVTEGTNTIVGRDPARIEAEVDSILRTGGKSGRRPELWDGNASGRIRDALVSWLEEKGQLDAVMEDEDRG